MEHGDTMPAVSDVTRKAVWDTLCDLEWQMRYYRAMADRRQRIHRWLRLALLVGIAVEGGILYGGTIYPWLFYVGIVGGLALAGLTIWDALSNYARDVAVCRLAAETCSLLMDDADDLWRKIETYRIEESEAEEALGYIRRWWDHATQRVDLEVDHSLNLASAESAHEEVVNRYAS